MKILELIIEGFKEAQIEFQKEVSPEIVKKTIDQYRDLVNRNQIKGAERNIDYWRKQGWKPFSDRVETLYTTPSKTQLKRSKVVGNSINLKENDEWLIVIPLDKDASCFHGKDTDWCTTKTSHGYYEKYFYTYETTLIYVLNKKSGQKWAIASRPEIDDLELFNQQDYSITAEDFQEETGFNPLELAKLAHDKYQPTISASRAGYTERMNKIRVLYSNTKFNRSPELEEMLIYTKNPEYCYYYINENGFGDYPEAIVLAAVNEETTVIKNVNNVSDSLMKKFLKLENPRIFYYINREIPLEIQTALVKNDPFNIQFLRNPDEQVQLMAIKYSPEVIGKIHNLTLRAEVEAVKQNPSMIAKSYYQRPEAQMAAVLQDPLIISYIHSPTPDVQVAAYNTADLDDKSQVFVSVRNKSPELIVAHRAKSWDDYIKVMIPAIKQQLVTGNPVTPMNNTGVERTMKRFLDLSNNADHNVSTNVKFWVKKINKFFAWWNQSLEQSQST